MNIITCPNCNQRILPKLDGTCPSCQAKIPAEALAEISEMPVMEANHVPGPGNKRLHEAPRDSGDHRGYIHVICPKCGTENLGSALECENCQTSLVGIQRIAVGEPPLHKPAVKTYPFDFIIDEAKSTAIAVPFSHCTNCFTALTPMSAAEITTIYTVAKQPVPTEPLPVLAADKEVSASFVSYQGSYRVTNTRRFNFRFPLCKKCFYDSLVLKKYEPRLYDPTYKEHPKRERVAIFFQIAGVLSIAALLFGGAKIADKVPGTAFVIWGIASVVCIIIGAVVLDMAKIYDKNLRSNLQSDASTRYGEVKVGSGQQEKSWGDDPNILKAIMNSHRFYRCQLMFRNEQYRDLLAGRNK